MNLHERMLLQISLKNMKAEFQEKLNTFRSSTEYVEAGFIEQSEMYDEFRDTNSILIEEIENLETELTDYIISKDGEDEGCEMCSG